MSDSYEYTITGIYNIEDVFRIYPTEVTDKLVIEKTQDYESTFEVSVIDLGGKEVLGVSASGEKQLYDVSRLPGGIYIVRIKTAETVHRVKIVKR